MTCVGFEARLDDLLDRRLPLEGDAELNEHTKACPHCARLIADHQALLQAVDLLAERSPEPISSKSHSHRTMAAKQPTASARALPRSTVWIAAAVAAAVLVAAGVRQWTSTVPTATIAERRSPDRDLVPPQSQRPMSREALAAGATDTRNLLAAQSAGEMESIASLIGPRQRTLMEQMSDGLKPVTHSMSAALNALRRTFPGSDAQRARG